MSKFNFLVYLNNYSDQNPSNNASLNNFKWTRNIEGIQNEESSAESFNLAPLESKVLFSGTRILPQDNTTTFNLTLKPFTQNIYRLNILSGPQDYFRTPRNLFVDDTTEVQLIKNGSVITISSIDGANMDTTDVIVGDSLRLGSLFSPVNQGEHRIISKTPNSISIINNLGANESVVLGLDYDEQLEIYSSSGIQIGDKLYINNGFSLASFGTYTIKDVSSNYLEFYSTSPLLEESSVPANITIYSESKQFVYLENTTKLALKINGNEVIDLEPFSACNASRPGVFMIRSTIFSLEVENKDLNDSKLFLITVK